MSTLNQKIKKESSLYYKIELLAKTIFTFSKTNILKHALEFI